MGQRAHRAEREEFLIAKALYLAIRLYDLYPEELRPEEDVAEMTRILHERFPTYARILEGPEPDVTMV